MSIDDAKMNEGLNLLKAYNASQGTKQQLKLINDTILIMLLNYKTPEAHKVFVDDLMRLRIQDLRNELVDLARELQVNIVHLEHIVSDVRYILNLPLHSKDNRS